MLASAARLKLPVLPQVGPNYIGMWVIFTSVLTSMPGRPSRRGGDSPLGVRRSVDDGRNGVTVGKEGFGSSLSVVVQRPEVPADVGEELPACVVQP